MIDAARAVKVIPVRPVYKENTGIMVKKRVAAYARVSTEKDEQQSSFTAQKDYYLKHIQSNPEWEFVGIYADEGISGTSIKKRDAFNKMVADALGGKIDLIITKSVSRFARNTVDSLTTIRNLKEKGVEIFFEKENIYTLDSKGELMIAIISSLAQEESRSLSTSISWGKRKRFADGKFSLPYGQFLGYEKGEDGFPRIVEKEARIVRLIYKLFLEGKTPSGIAKHLTDKKIPTPAGKKKWPVTTVKSILTNEKMCGNAMLQKRFTEDFLTKKMKVNEGEVAQYFIENSHDPIISPEIFELVQEEFRRRKAAGIHTSAINCFASRIVCGDCGGFYGRKVWHSNTKYAQTIWQCNNMFQKREFCSTPHLKEEILKDAFTAAFNSIIENKEEILRNVQNIIDSVTCSRDQESQCEKIDTECLLIETAIEKLVAENARAVIDQDEYNKRYHEWVAKYNGLQKKRQALVSAIAMQQARRNQMKAFTSELKQQDKLLDAFDEGLWCATVHALVVKSDHEVVFQFKDGSELHWGIG